MRRVQYIWGVFAILVLALFVEYSESQGCELWQGEPAICGELYQANSTYIWTAGFPQSVLAELMKNDSNDHSKYQLIAVKSLAKGCYLRSVVLLCTGYLPPCKPSDLSDPAYIESLTCASTCVEANTYCAGVTPPNDCSQLNPFRGTAAFPEAGFTASYNNVTYNLTCSVPSAAYLNQNYTTNCQGPLRPSPSRDGTCTLRCPTHFYTDKEWTVYMILQEILGWMGFISIIFVLIPFLIIKERRQPPIAAQTWLLVSLIPLTIGCLMPTFDKYDIFCRSNTRKSTRHFAPCVLQAMFIHFSTLAAMSWCMWLLFDALFLVLTSKRALVRTMFPYQAAFSVGFASIHVIIALAAKAYDSVTNTTFCFIKSSSGPSVFSGWDTWLFWMPVAIFWCMTVLLWFALFICLLRRVGTKTADIMFALRSQLRLLLFVGYFFIALGTLYLYRFIQKPKGASFETALTNHVLCWAAKAAGAPVSCRPRPYPRTNYFFDLFSSNMNFASPFVFCVILGAVSDVILFYRKLFEIVRSGDCNWANLQQLGERSNLTSSRGASAGGSASAGQGQSNAVISASGGVDEEF